MKKNQQKQQGATLISWMIMISVAILIVSGALKVGPNYVEYNSVKSFMDGIAAEPGIERQNKREILSRVERYLNINGMESLSQVYYEGKTGKGGAKNPFSVVKLRKSNKRELMVEYEVKKPWLGNLSFLMNYKYSVELGKQK